jgi:hypothetical protein
VCREREEEGEGGQGETGRYTERERSRIILIK